MNLVVIQSIAYYYRFRLCNIVALRHFFVYYLALSTHTDIHSNKFLTLFYTNSYILSYNTQIQITKHTHMPQKLKKKHDIFYTLPVILIHLTLILHKQLIFDPTIIDWTCLVINDIYHVLAATIIPFKSTHYE